MKFLIYSTTTEKALRRFRWEGKLPGKKARDSIQRDIEALRDAITYLETVLERKK